MIKEMVYVLAAFLLLFFIFLVRKYVKNFEGEVLLETGVAIITVGLFINLFYEFIGYNIMILGILVSFFGVTKIFKSLKEIAIKDHLTGLHTRYYFFEEWLPQEMERQKRKKGSGIAFLIIDLDDFKEINDRYSHKIGDKLLKHVSHEILKNIRKTDCAVRFGGDEILIAFPDIDEKSVLNIVKRLEKRLKFNPIGLPINFSYGIETWKPGENIENIIQKADIQMYTLKNMRKQYRALTKEPDVD
ncbi:diguanylate cyclase [Thermotoga sp. KOL6]|nr:diguanylate cyclase [Thermotoga sp. KOL6]